MKEKTKRTIAFYSMISPWFVVFILFGLFPMLYGLYLSFTNYYGFNIKHLKWTGFHNYHKVFTDSDAMYSLGRTLYVTAINVPLSVLIGLGLAMLLNKQVKGVGVYRTLFYLPSIVPPLASVIMWKFIFSSNNGIFNGILDRLGLPTVNWLGYDYATPSLLIMLLWGAGGGIIINLAGLKGIPRDLYEAASIDGATPFKRTIYLTMPLMTPVIFFNVINGIIGSLQILMQPILLNGTELLSRPIQPNYLYAVHAFQQVFAFQRFAYGMALLWILFLAILILSIIVFTTSKYWVHYETDQE
ncbi:carbohydrate ABC transporter permease [Paenibacillus sacheonensis]|uniref:ABC transporter permease subunit n=1 Tax=Paenibacillus sacheonensis TaxID=742054 RepID=A0A7X4YUB4_9BACL|nr:sugar ABC transporter permease [Paenibacillus sacheonensis]MBM7568986.1 multiple sugar transport system permease protein [Paenibacillus sacheonensis]NBC72643.1 ABC transporter permease subunit [Paenibacillus sacheonensis]